MDLTGKLIRYINLAAEFLSHWGKQFYIFLSRRIQNSLLIIALKILINLHGNFCSEQIKKLFR